MPDPDFEIWGGGGGGVKGSVETLTELFGPAENFLSIKKFHHFLFPWLVPEKSLMLLHLRYSAARRTVGLSSLRQIDSLPVAAKLRSHVHFKRKCFSTAYTLMVNYNASVHKIKK